LIIKSHIRGGFRSAAHYLKEQGMNEKTRLVEISDPSAKNLDEAFQNMWAIASNTKCTKPLHHISINPMKGEVLTDKQVLAIIDRCEQKYGYKLSHHQRVIVEHVKDGRQHFHVIWNRVSHITGKPVWPGEHWNKSKQICREMEKELGLKRPTPRRTKTVFIKAHRRTKALSPSRLAATGHVPILRLPIRPLAPVRPARYPPSRVLPLWYRQRQGEGKNYETMPSRSQPMGLDELIAWAFANGRLDILAQYGIYLPADYFEP
jgi:hypothetical protein